VNPPAAPAAPKNSSTGTTVGSSKASKPENAPDNDAVNSRAVAGSEWGGPSTVGWAYSIDDTIKLARFSRAPVGVYFCDPRAMKTAGEGADAAATFRKN